MTTSAGRKTVSYLVRCALASGDTLVKQDQNNTSYTYSGSFGLCPQWKYGGVSTDATCQEFVSACMMAHVNTAGIHIPIWLDSQQLTINNQKIGFDWGLNPSFPYQEGTFFGNIIATGSLSAMGKPSVTAPAAYYCDGDGFATGSGGEVAGRLGAGQTSAAPYLNPFSDPLCKNSPGAVMQWSAGKNNADGSVKDPDGYSTLNTGTPWNNAVTVWRSGSYTPVFDPSYVYEIFSLLTRSNPMVIDTTATNPVVQQPMSSNYASSQLLFTANGSNWSIALAHSPSMCLDAGAGTSTSTISVQSCNSSSTSQQWTITPLGNSYGSFMITNVKGGMALTVTNPGSSTLQKQAGVKFDVEAYQKWSAQQFRIQAVATVN
jgi:hypothetical protein